MISSFDGFSNESARLDSETSNVYESIISLQTNSDGEA